MNYKLILFIIFTFLSAYSLTGINFEKLIRKNKIIETKVLFVLISLLMGYFLTNLIYFLF